MLTRRRINNHPARGFAVLPSDGVFVKTLTGEVQNLLVLRDEGYNYEAIAAQTNMPVGTVKSKLNRARIKILAMRAKAAAKTPEAAHV